MKLLCFGGFSRCFSDAIVWFWFVFSVSPVLRVSVVHYSESNALVNTCSNWCLLARST